MFHSAVSISWEANYEGTENSITAQTLFIVCAMLLLVNIFLGAFLLSRSKTLMKTLINQRMLDISNTAADMLDGGVEDSHCRLNLQRL